MFKIILVISLMAQSSIQYEYSNYSSGSSAYYNMHSSSLYIQAEILLYIHTWEVIDPLQELVSVWSLEL